MKKITAIFLSALIVCLSVSSASAQPKKMVFSTIHGLTITAIGERLLQQAYQQLNIDISTEAYPGERSLVAANTGKTDGELGRIAGLEKDYPNLIMVPVPLMQLSVSAFSNKKLSVQSFEDLKKYRMGYVGGTKIVEKMTANFTNRLPVSRPEQLFEMLMLGRIDVAVHTTEDGLLILQNNKYTAIKIISPPLVQANIYHYLNKKNADLVPAITQALQKMTDDGTFQKERADFFSNIEHSSRTTPQKTISATPMR